MSGMEILKRANIFCNQACIINSFRFYVGGEYYNFHEGGNFHKIQCRYNVIWLKGLKEEARRNLFALKPFFTFLLHL